MNRVQFDPQSSPDQKISQLADALSRIADQANIDLTGAQQGKPSTISALNVTEQGGIHDIQIVDNSPAYAGLQYAVEYSQSPDFSNSHKIDLGTSQNHRANLGSGKYYWRASSSYHPATTSAHVYYGGANPSAVGAGSYVGPTMQQGQSFRGKYRNSSTPPVRK